MIARQKEIEAVVKMLREKKIASRSLLRIELMSPVIRRKYNFTPFEIEKILDLAMVSGDIKGLQRVDKQRTVYNIGEEDPTMTVAERRNAMKDNIKAMKKAFPDIKFSMNVPRRMTIKVKGMEQPLAIYDPTFPQIVDDNKLLIFISAYREVERTISGDYLRFNFIKENSSLSYHDIFGIVRALEAEGKATLKADPGGNLVYFKAKLPKGVKKLKENVFGKLLKNKALKKGIQDVGGDGILTSTEIVSAVKKGKKPKDVTLTDEEAEKASKSTKKRPPKRVPVTVGGEVLVQQLFPDEADTAEIEFIQKERVRQMMRANPGVRFSPVPYPISEESLANVKGMRQPRAVWTEAVRGSNQRVADIRKIVKAYKEIIGLTKTRFVTFNSLHEYSGLPYNEVFNVIDGMLGKSGIPVSVAIDRKGFRVAVRINDYDEWEKYLDTQKGVHLDPKSYFIGKESLQLEASKGGKRVTAEKELEKKSEAEEIKKAPKNKTRVRNVSGVLPPQIDSGSPAEMAKRQQARVSVMEKTYPGIKFSVQPYPTEMEKYNFIPGALQPRAIFNPQYKPTDDMRLMRQVVDSYLKLSGEMPAMGGYVSFNVIVEDTKIAYKQVFEAFMGLWKLVGRENISLLTDKMGYRVTFKLQNVPKLNDMLIIPVQQQVAKKEMDEIDKSLADDTPIVLKKVPKHKKQTI